MTQTILITGASTGIGKATAKHFQEKGWNVVATMRRPEAETELSGLERVLVTRLDVEDSASITAAVKAAFDKFGGIDVLLNNAGYGAVGPMEAAGMDKIRRQFDVNFFGLIEVTKAVLPHFREKKAGIILNVSSVGGRVTMPLTSLYHASKFAVEGLSESLRYELGLLGITIKLIEPGAIVTDFATRSLDLNNDESLTEYQGMIEKYVAAMNTVVSVGSPASLAAEVIYTAATDGKDTLRYTVGADAEQFLGLRAAKNDEDFQAAMLAQFGF